MTIFTVIGISACVVLGTLFAGLVMASIITRNEINDAGFYTFMFFGSWAISTTFLIIKLVGPLLGK